MKTIYQYFLAGCLIAAPVFMTSCEDVDELPPRTEETTSNPTYKMPEPTVLTAEESTTVSEIMKEYQENVK